MSDATGNRPQLWISAQDSHRGVVRIANEDAIMSSPEDGLWAVADGMGGHEAGDVASNMIIDKLTSVTITSTSLDESIAMVKGCLFDANRSILEYAENRLKGRTLGSTVLALIIRNDAGACLWAGDSRLYRYRDNYLQQISRDHSHVEELVSEGIISREEARHHPHANIITRAIGTNRKIDIDMLTFGIQQDDIFLLCSDGLYSALSDDEIAGCLDGYRVNEAVRLLINKALDNGAKDNVSVIVVKAEEQTSN